MAWRIGIDIGGTFTDVALVDEASGRIEVAKVPTTPADFGQAVITGIRQGLAANAIAAADVALLAHATTVVTNALLEKKGARAGFVATCGFRDLLELRRSSRADLYDLLQDAPDVLVPRRWRFEITERIDAQGAVVTPLAEAEIPALIEAIRAAGLQTVAVSFLFSFLNDAHERRIGAALRQALPEVQVYLSCEVLPEIREFERASTTAVCAYVGPLLGAYLDRLQRAASDLGLPQLHVMGSSGGVFDIAEALRMPAMAVESGPAAGVIAAALAGRQLGRPNLISLDMGGTTAKASVIAGGEISVTAEYEVGGAGHANRWMHGTGHPIRVPVIDLAEVSAGGGSIAWVDPGGALKVGPHSAGADPGPAAYGAGGTAPTVTDADVVLGYLDRAALLGGALRIDSAAAERAIAADVGDPLGLSVVEAAARIVEVVNSNMAQALRIVSVERGHDPSAFSLIAFGGAGPVHAAALAAELQIPEVIIPPAPGAFSALGLVASDLKRDFSRTLYADLDNIDPGAHRRRAFRDGGRGAALPGQRQRAAAAPCAAAAGRCAIPAPGLRADCAGRGRGDHARHAASAGGVVSCETRADLRPCQSRRAGAACQSAADGGGTFARADADPAQRCGVGADAESGRLVRRERVCCGTGALAGWSGAGCHDRRAGDHRAMDSTTVVPPGWRAVVDDRGYIRMSRG